MGSPRSLAVYTTVHPAALPYLGAFFAALEHQMDGVASLWIGHDDLRPEEVEARAGRPLAARWVAARTRDTPASLRRRALGALVREHDTVVLLDSDDVAYPGAVEAARAGLARHDVWSCAMDVVDADGAPTGVRLGLVPGATVERTLPHANVVGFGNAAYRSDVLADCLQVPDDAVAMDWLVASRAHLRGASFAFDPEPRLAYRQHGRSVARVLPPFDAETLLAAARVVDRHYATLLADVRAPASRLAPYRAAAARAAAFRTWLEAEPRHARAYLDDLHARPRRTVLWWDHVAAPEWRVP